MTAKVGDGELAEEEQQEMQRNFELILPNYNRRD